MAIIKHKAYKGSNYEKIIDYLELEHDSSGKVLKDDSGQPVRRKDILMDGINCSPITFAAECEMVNRKFNKNNKKGEVRSHGYIISFDPRDAEDNGLTKEQVQAFGMEFATKCLPGYQTIVYTHTDGHNGSGNLHCHIVINSIRIMDVPRESYMDQPMDHHEGAKHRCTPEFENYIKARLMEMCQERNLYQVDLLSPAEVRITDREYFLQKNGSEIYGKDFQTRKDFIRSAIENTAIKVKTIDEFKTEMLKKYRIDVKESRGRFSYLLPGWERGITERQLGSFYSLEFIGKVIAKEAQFISRNEKPVYKSENYIPADIKKIVDVSLNQKAKESKPYERKVIISNLKKEAKTFNLLSAQKLTDVGQIDSAIRKIVEAISDNSSQLKTVETRIKQIRQTLSEKENDIPVSVKELRGFSKEQLTEELKTLALSVNRLYENRSQMKKDLRDLQNAKYNIESIIGRDKQERGQYNNTHAL